jgi:hypothetical protein
MKFRRLTKAILRGQPIRTKELNHWGRRVFLVPTNIIARTERSYSYIRKHGSNRLLGRDSGTINRMRKVIRSGKELPPIYLQKSSFNDHYTLEDGHHRLTAHQAEGKKYIKAVILGPEGWER